VVKSLHGSLECLTTQSSLSFVKSSTKVIAFQVSIIVCGPHGGSNVIIDRSNVQVQTFIAQHLQSHVVAISAR